MADNTARDAALVQFAQKAVIVNQGRMLLVRKATTDPYQPGKWELPGGRLEERELLDMALYREVWEEVGLAVEPGRPLALWQFRIGAFAAVAVDVIAVARLCVPKTLEVSLKTGTHDHLDKFEWVKVHEVLYYDLIRSTRTAMKEIIGQLDYWE